MTAVTLPPARNPRALASVLLALLSIAAVPAGVAVSYYREEVTLLWSGAGSIPAGILLGWMAIVQGRRGREQVQRTLGRSGGEGAATAGRLLGTFGVCLAITAGLAVGFYALLTFFAD